MIRSLFKFFSSHHHKNNYTNATTDSNFDAIDGLFKKTYPETATVHSAAHPVSYRKIPSIFDKENAPPETTPIQVNRAALEVGETKEKSAYLITTPERISGNDHQDTVVVSAHGCVKNDTITLTPNMPTLVFLGPHDASLDARLYEYDRKPYAEVTHHGITLMSEQAKEDFDKYGFKKITGTSELGAVCNYYLEKYKDPRRDPRGTVNFEDLVYQLDWISPRKIKLAINENNKKVDALSIRKKASDFSAFDAVAIAQEHAYERVIFSFCRVNAHNKNPNVYEAGLTVPLTKPSFYSWNELKDLEKRRLQENNETSHTTPRPR